MSIRLSERHGVNPSVMQCYFCGEAAGVALLGRLPGDKEAPRQAVYDMEPCTKCKEWMTKGILLMSIRNDEQRSANPYRTGGWCVVKEEAFRKMFKDVDEALKRRFAFVEDRVWDDVGLPRENVAEQPNAS